MNIPKYIHLYGKELSLRNYSQNTIKSYSSQLESFLKYYDLIFTEPVKINEVSIKEWLSQFKTRNSMCQSISALKLFYTSIVKQPLKFKHIQYPREEKRLPQVIDKDFLLKKVAEIENLKHKAIISLAFSVGLRVSEVTSLKIADVDSKRMLITIRQAKGNKDRLVPLSEGILELLRKYFRQYRPEEYLFNGQKNLKYSSTSCNQIVKKYLGKEYHFHTLRHSSFTSMLESGTDLRLIQKIAGHSSSKTTELYVHVSKNLLLTANTPL